MTTVNLSWAATAGATFYKVYGSNDGVNFFLLGSPTQTSYSHDAGHALRWWYRVSSCNASFESAPSTAATPVDWPPTWPNPFSLSGTAGQQIDVSGYAADRDTVTRTFSLVAPIPSGYSMTSVGMLTLGSADAELTLKVTAGGLSATTVVDAVIQPPYATFATGYDETYYVADSDTNGWRSAADTVRGWDWSFPDNTTVAPLSGIFMFTNQSAFPNNMRGKRIYKINADWWQMERSEGNYSGIASVFAPLNEILTTGIKNGLPWDGVQVDVRGIVYSINGLTSAEARVAGNTDSDVPDNVTAPDWLADYLPNTAACRTSGQPNNDGNVYVFFNFAHEAWYSRFRMLIDAISNYTIGTGANAFKIPNHPMLAGQIVHAGGTDSAGEESGYGWETAGQPTSKNEAAKTVRRWSARYNKTTATSSDGIAGFQSVDCRPKLEWVGQNAKDAEDWSYTRSIIESGMGSRGGLMERWLEGRKTPRNSTCWVGQSCEAYKNSAENVQSSAYYLIPDPTDPRIINLRWFGDQNEEWRSILATSNKGWLTIPEKWQMHYRMSTISTLARMLNNTAMEDKDTSLHGSTPTSTDADYANHGVEGFVNPEIIRWLSVNLGKRPFSSSESSANETNEAFCLLSRMRMRGGAAWDPIAPAGFNGGTYENPVNSSNLQVNDAVALHNIERWLTQREPDGATTPAITVLYGYNPAGGDPPLSDANSMEIAKTGSQIGFQLDDRMRFGVGYGSGQIAVKVTYYEDVNTGFTLKYTRSDGLTGSVAKAAPGATAVADPKVRTTTFFINDFVNKTGVINFRLDSSGVKFMFVRVIRV